MADRNSAVPPATRAERRRLAREQGNVPARGRRPGARPPVWRSPLVLMSVAAISLGILGVVILGGFRGAPDAAPVTGLIAPPTLDPRSGAIGETLGQPSSVVTLEVWSDFQCPICGRFAREYLPRLVADFVVPGRLRIVEYDIAILDSETGGESVAAAVGASCAADQGRYWPFHDLLFWNQAGENRGAFGATRLSAMADRLELNRPAWESCRDDPARAGSTRSITARAAAAGIDRTPTFRLQGRLLVGLPASYEALAAAIRNAAPGGLGSPSAP